MISAAFQRCLPVILVREAGWSDNPHDPGGPTNKGITLATLSRYLGRAATLDELRNISDQTLQAIYSGEYWSNISCDDLPVGVDLMVFDSAVNNGPVSAARILQRVLQLPQIDGVVGPVTIAAAHAANPMDLIGRLRVARATYYRGLSGFEVFGRGWLNRLEAVANTACAWATKGPSSEPGSPVEVASNTVEISL